MAKRWNGKKMSHGSKTLPRPLKIIREAKKKQSQPKVGKKPG